MRISLLNRQRKLACKLQWLRRFAASAATHCLQAPAQAGTVLNELPEVTIALVSDAAIARLHLEFMGLPEATDVITFQHGEIAISVETAAGNAVRFRRSMEEEIALYIVHGLLHLHGYLDKKAADSARMQKTQSAILRRCISEIGPP
jgi:probable rRNA maturation factor